MSLLPCKSGSSPPSDLVADRVLINRRWSFRGLCSSRTTACACGLSPTAGLSPGRCPTARRGVSHPTSRAAALPWLANSPIRMHFDGLRALCIDKKHREVLRGGFCWLHPGVWCYTSHLSSRDVPPAPYLSLRTGGDGAERAAPEQDRGGGQNPTDPGGQVRKEPLDLSCHVS